MRITPPIFIGLALAVLCAAEEPRRWNVTAECQMIVLPQKLALPLLPQLNDEATIESAYAQLQEWIAKGDAQLAAHIVAKALDGEKAEAVAVEEFRYATEYDPPHLPTESPVNLEVLKAWPVVGITPTAFETRNIGASLEFECRVQSYRNVILTTCVPQQVRFLRWVKADAGVLPDGKRLFVEQPIFHSVKTTSIVALRNGQRVLLGVHKLPEPADALELFVLKVSAVLAP